MPPPADACPRCDAPRVDGPECPRCGVIYARARPRVADAVSAGSAAGAAVTLAEPAAPSLESADYIALARADAARHAWHFEAHDARVELALRTLGPPIAFAVASFAVATAPGRALVRTFLSMWLHELGHAAAAWLCGLVAVPGPWRTFMADGGRSVVLALTVAGGFAFVGWRGWTERRPFLVGAAAVGLAAQLVCLLLSRDGADAFITFCGDGGALVLATLLCATVYAQPGSWFRQGALRWGFLAIGAATFADVYSTWLAARSDVDAIPFGEIEGVGLSDASRLLQIHGWGVGRMTGTYVALGGACALVLVALYVVGALAARATVRRFGSADGGQRP